MPRFSRAFTLIELLVVISIIGILATVILVALNGARQKGVLGAAQEFDKSAYAGWYSDTTAAWDFDEGSTGGVVPDQSGNNNNLTLTNASQLQTSFNPLPSGKTLFIDNAADGAVIQPSLKNPPTGSFSVSFWVYIPTANPNNAIVLNDSYNLAHSNSWEFIVTVNGMTFNYMSASGVPNTISAGAFQSNQWYQFVGVCDNNLKKIGLYVNGKYIGSSAAFSSGGCATYVDPINPITIMPGSASYQYYIDNVRIYRQAMPISLIEREYAAESPLQHVLAFKAR